MKPAIVVKLSGAALGDSRPISPRAFRGVAAQLDAVRRLGHRIGVVVGGGNIYRGSEAWAEDEDEDLQAEKRDNLGMLATSFNAQALLYALERRGLPAHLIALPGISAPLARPWNDDDLATTTDIVVVAGGTGRSGVSSDVAAPLLAQSLGAQLIIMSKHNVRGVFTSDPNAPEIGLAPPRFLDSLTTKEALDMGLQIMDRKALQLCQELGCLIHIVNANEGDTILQAALGGRVGSTIRPVTHLASEAFADMSR